jgi:hypothetical protein
VLARTPDPFGNEPLSAPNGNDVQFVDWRKKER